MTSSASSSTGRISVHYPTPSNPLYLSGVIFDMDGTLTDPVLDFVRLRKNLGIDYPHDILTVIEEYPEDKKAVALQIIEDEEEHGRKNLKVRQGAKELLEYLRDDIKIPMALITRNSKTSLDHFIELSSFALDPAISREFKPAKPHPASALHVCTTWNVHPRTVLFVGDGKDDILCGSAAGTMTCLLADKEKPPRFFDEVKPDFVLKELDDLITLFRTGALHIKRE